MPENFNIAANVDSVYANGSSHSFMSKWLGKYNDYGYSQNESGLSVSNWEEVHKPAYSLSDRSLEGEANDKPS